jgi:hypothetical protein
MFVPVSCFVVLIGFDVLDRFVSDFLCLVLVCAVWCFLALLYGLAWCFPVFGIVVLNS